MIEYRELNQFQIDLLENVANLESVVFGMVIPIETDKPEIQEKMWWDIGQIVEMVEMGFVQDISSKFRPQIEECVKTTGRGYMVYQLTDSTVTMFANAENQRIN
jgi:hypothetical protein